MYMKIRPEYFVVGTAKAGTTSLFRYFSTHPSVYVPPNKETYFFGEYFYADAKINSLPEYKSLFKTVPKESICVEISTTYLYSRNAAKEIYKYNPDARIIMILRNPMDRAFSNYMYRRKTGNEECTQFEEGIKMENERIVSGKPYGFHYTNMGFYYKQVQRYLDIFKKENVLILIFEEIKENSNLFYQRISDFMEIQYLSSFNVSKRYNKSGEFRSERFMKLLNSDNIVKKYFKKMIPQEKRKRLSGFFKDLNISNRKIEMKPETRIQMRDLFNEDIHKLEALTGKDLSFWS